VADTTLLLSISGRVQGVGYRAWALRTAQRLKLNGWVRNRRDGTVETLAQGDKETIDEFVTLCRRGPTFARVETVEQKTPDADVPPMAAGEFKQIETA